MSKALRACLQYALVKDHTCTIYHPIPPSVFLCILQCGSHFMTMK